MPTRAGHDPCIRSNRAARAPRGAALPGYRHRL